MRNERGYVLLVSVMIIGLMLIGLAVAATRTLTAERAATVTLDRSTEARALAEACADTALLKLRTSPLYLGSEVIPVGSSTCTIRPILLLPTRIETEAIVNAQPYRLRVTLSSLNPMTISGWQRVATFN